VVEASRPTPPVGVKFEIDPGRGRSRAGIPAGMPFLFSFSGGIARGLAQPPAIELASLRLARPGSMAFEEVSFGMVGVTSN
jgi:hypothetical protein